MNTTPCRGRAQGVGLRVPDHEFDPLKWRVGKTFGGKFFLRRVDELLSRGGHHLLPLRRRRGRAESEFVR
jgi:hypothetical protein